jgi:hypothetical protein
MREQDEPDDMYEVGGFIEYHSKTPSFPHQVTNRYWPRQFHEIEGTPQTGSMSRCRRTMSAR